MADESDDEGGIGGKKLAAGAVVLLGVALLVRVLRGGDDRAPTPRTGGRDDPTGARGRTGGGRLAATHSGPA